MRVSAIISVDGSCKKHQLRLLYNKCPNCEVHLPIPAEWESGRCRQCQMLLKSMIKHQKPAQTPKLMDISVSRLNNFDENAMLANLGLLN